MSEIVSYSRIDNIALITINNPPVNAMSQAVRQGLCDAMEQLANDADADAAVIICEGRTFIAGADIKEFGKPPLPPSFPETIGRIESSDKPVVAAIHGTALGGGYEVALGCHYRCAVNSAKVGLPEVNLGLIPGAGGTQRLPRVAGVENALEMILSGKHVPAEEALKLGAIDEIISSDLKEGAIAYAKKLVDEKAGPRKISEMSVDVSGLDADYFDQFRAKLEKTHRGFMAPYIILQAVQAATELPFDESMKKERELFEQCRDSDKSRAQRALFFAERAVSKVPDVPKDTTPRDINTVAVIGAGTMGSGIAMNFLNAGIPVTLVETEKSYLDKGMTKIAETYASSVSKGRMSEEQKSIALELLSGSIDYSEISQVDLVIEAVFEDMDIKKSVFSKLDEVVKQGAILASNTSTLDIDVIAATTKRPQDIIGLHFFAPANIMKLLEIVRGKDTAIDVIATAMNLSKRIKKTGVLVGNCFGFVGNRMLIPYTRESQLMMLEGVSAERIDQVAYDWGMAMGPNAVMDLSGLDVMQFILEAMPDKPADPAFYRIVTLLVEAGRNGQKTGKGIYTYDGRTAVPDADVASLVQKEAESLGIEQRDISDEEIIERLFYSMINEGAKILEEGYAMRASDIDVIWTSGYGMPRYRGGPMMTADIVGVNNIYSAVCKYQERYDEQYWQPAQLLKDMAAEGQTFY